MRKVKLSFAAAILAVSFAALPLRAAESSDVAVQSSVSLQACCYVYWHGVWQCLPC
jgi:hypothetical protein